MKSFPATSACAVRERTADGESVGRCWFHIKSGVCPRHGDVSKVQAEYARSGCLTDERDLNLKRHNRGV
jgi:hypothetical protein